MNKSIVVAFSITLLTCWTGCPTFAVEENAAFQFSVLDFAVPTSPAFIAVDATPEAIIRPDTPHNLALELLNGTDPNGTLQTGMAFNSVPYFLVYGGQTSLTDYQRWKWWGRALRTAGLSLATTKASDSDDDAVRLGVGLRATLLDLGDPQLDKAFVGCVRDQLAGC